MKPANKFIVPGIVILLAVGLIMFIYFSGKRAGRTKEMLNQGQDKPLPNAGTDIPSGWSPDGMVAQLHSAIKGIDGWAYLTYGMASNSAKKAAYGALVQLTAGQLTAVYNLFNQRYGKVKDGQYTETLYDWIKDDSGDDSRAKALGWLEANKLGPGIG